ncbi:MAG: hypothetical protein C5B60_03835 [Chloroflexi bacterium]|nr:MAG: hypothetical protein C5B60_03835 [Chloroflexota bacterium]
MASLGLGLGLTPRQQAKFTAAAGGGQDAFTQYLQAHANIAKQLGALEGAKAGSSQGQTWANLTQQYGLKPVAAPPSTNPAVTNPNAGGAIPPAPNTTGTQDPNWYQKMVSQYELPMPPELTAVGQYAQQNLARLNPMNTPSYQEQFNTYKDLMERELDKQTADLTEAYGARGGRYSSDLTTAAGTMRRQGLQDLAATSLTALTNLNTQRMQEVSGSINALAGVGASRGNMMMNAAQTGWQDYLLGTSPPELLNSMLNWSSTFSPPGSVLTPGK